MTTPKRVQQRRSKGWKKPDGESLIATARDAETIDRGSAAAVSLPGE
jgi:hypothetical protein